MMEYKHRVGPAHTHTHTRVYLPPTEDVQRMYVHITLLLTQDYLKLVKLFYF